MLSVVCRESFWLPDLRRCDAAAARRVVVEHHPADYQALECLGKRESSGKAKPL